jgi:very-short-patch-repair endonuclease
MFGHKFRRQHPIGPFIADFVCIENKLIIELDGGQHSLSIESESKRTEYLESKGFEWCDFGITRFWKKQRQF